MVDISRRHGIAEGFTYVGGFSAVPRLLAEFGCEPTTILEQAGLARDVLDAPANMISAADLSRLFKACVVGTQCPHVGLLVGQRSERSSLAVVRELVQCS